MNERLQLILSALGNAVLSNIWHTGLLWLLVLLCSKFYKNLSPSRLSNLSFAALISSFVAFVATFCLSLFSQKTDAGVLQWLANSTIINAMTSYAAVVYIILLFVPVIRLAIGFKNVHTLKRKGISKVPGHLRIFLSDACQYLSIKRNVKIFASNIVHSPLTVGLLKPIILLPVAMVNQLSIHQAEAIILHELSHIKRYDYLQNIITQIILTILYFNPFAKLLAKQQNLEREKCADNQVIQFEYNKLMYATTLLELAKQNIPHCNKLAIPVSGSSAPLLERIEWITGIPKRRYPSIKSLIVVVAIVLAFFSVSLLKSRIAIPTTHNDLAFFAHNKNFHFASELFTDDTINNRASKTNDETKQVVTSREKMQSPKPTLNTAPTKCEKTPQPETKELIPAFVNNTVTVIPALPECEENNVQNAIASTQKIITEISWQAIDNTLAETVTTENKQALKEQFSRKLQNNANWQKQANLLRLYYNNIDWKTANKNLITALNEFKADSIYQHCKQMVTELKNYKAQIENNTTKETEVATLKNLIEYYNANLKTLDSLRPKKIVEL